MMAEGSGESPLDLQSVLTDLESAVSSDEQVLEGYNQLVRHMTNKLSLFEQDFVQNGRRLLAVTRKHITANGELQLSITPKALNVMGCCVNNKDIVSLLTTDEMIELVNIWSKIIAETKEKNTCTYAFWCLSNQAFPPHIMCTELPGLMNTFSRAAVSWWNASTMVENAAMIAIQRLGMQCPKEMKALCPKWGPPYLRLLVSQSAQTREHAFGKVQKWAVFLATSKEFQRNCISTVTNQIIPVLNSMFSNGMEASALKTCTLLIQIFKQEVQNIQLLNSLLSVQEQAFRCSSSEVRCQAFQSWGILIDILNDKGILQKAKFVELIMRVFKTRNTNTEQVAVAKLNTWWHYVMLMGPTIWAQFDQILRPLLQFCLGSVRLGVDSTPSLLRALLEGEAAQVPMSCSSPGPSVDLPTFPRTQQGGLLILTYLLQDSDHPAAFSFDLEPLKTEHSMPLDVCIKNSRILISAVVEFSKLFGATHEVQVVYVWERMTAFIVAAVNKDRDESSAAVSAFFSQFQNLIEASVLSGKTTMKLFQLICSLSDDVLTSTSLDGSLFKCRAHSLCEVLLSSSALCECGDQERFVTLFMTLVKCGTKHPGGSLAFLESVGRLLDSRASVIPGAQALWRLWSFVANTVHNLISSTNQVDQDDDLWPNFGCLYTVLLLPIAHLMAPSLPQSVQKSALKTLSELYHTFARLAALVTTAEANMIVEDFAHRISSTLSQETYTKDPQTLDHVLGLCSTMVESIDFSSLTSANPFMKGLRSTPSSGKHRQPPRPLGNLHSFLALLAKLTTWVTSHVYSEGMDKPAPPPAAKQKSDSLVLVGSCCGKLMEIFSTVVTSVTVSSLVSHMIESLAPALATLFSVVPRKLPAKVCTPSFTQKLERLWQDVCHALRTHYKGQYDSDLLHQMAPLLHAAFLHPRRFIKNHTVAFWNSTFGAGSAPLSYPKQLQGVLLKMREKTQMSLPGWVATDVTIDDSPASQMSLMDSQAPEPVLPGIPSPVHIRGSFLNKDVSPKPASKTTPKKPVTPVSENKRFNARKRLPLESMPQKDFVVIQGTPNKKRVLTEHQKEVMREKRMLPAMYNNLEASQDISLMAHFSSESTQQESLMEKPTVDDVIVVKSSQSQDPLTQKQGVTGQAENNKSETPKTPIPRRLTRRSSVRFQDTAKEDSQMSEESVKAIPEKVPEVTSVSDSSALKLSKSGQSTDASDSALETQPQVITITDSLSQEQEKPSGQENSPRLTAPPPSQKVDSPVCKQGSPFAVPGLGKKSMSAVKQRSSSQEAGRKRPVGRPPRSAGRLQHRARSLDFRVRKLTDEPYTNLKEWLRRENMSPAPKQTEKQATASEPTEKDDKDSAVDIQSAKLSSQSEKQRVDINVLVEETKSPIDTSVDTNCAVTSVQETPTKDSCSRPFSGVKTRSKAGGEQLFQSVVSLGKELAGSEQATPLPSPMEDSPSPMPRFSLQPPVVCEEVASQGFPVAAEDPQSVQHEQRTRKRKRNEVDDSSSVSNASHEQHSDLGFSGLLKQTLDQGSDNGSQLEVDSCPGQDSTGLAESSEQEYDPDLAATLRSTPLRRSSRTVSSQPSGNTDSEEHEAEMDTSENLPQPSQSLTTNTLASSPPTFDPARDSTLDMVSEHSRKRKQHTPKRIADPSALRRTPRRNSQKKAGCECCRVSPGGDRSAPGSSPSRNICKKKLKDLKSPLGGRSPRVRLIKERLKLTPGPSQQTSTDDQGGADSTEKKATDDGADNLNKKAKDCGEVSTEKKVTDDAEVSIKKKAAANSLKKRAQADSDAVSLTKKVSANSGADSAKKKAMDSDSDSLKKKAPTDSDSSENGAASLKKKSRNEADNLKKKGQSMQDLCEVTPESKTAITPLRESTTARKLLVARQKSASKSLRPVLDRVSDSESSQLSNSHESQSSSKTTHRWKKDVFNSKEEQNMTALTGMENTDTQSFAAVMKSPPKLPSDDSASFGVNKSTPQKFNERLRTPPKLRLRQKKSAPTAEASDDSKIPDTGAKETRATNSAISTGTKVKTAAHSAHSTDSKEKAPPAHIVDLTETEQTTVNNDHDSPVEKVNNDHDSPVEKVNNDHDSPVEKGNNDHDSPVEKGNKSGSGKQRRLSLRSKRKRRSSGEERGKVSSQKRKGPATMTRSRRSPTLLSNRSLATTRRAWLRNHSSHVTRANKQSPALKAALTKTLNELSEEASEDFLIEDYDSSDEDDRPLISLTAGGEQKSKLKKNLSLDAELQSKPKESSLKAGQVVKPAESQLAEGDKGEESQSPGIAGEECEDMAVDGEHGMDEPAVVSGSQDTSAKSQDATATASEGEGSTDQQATAASADSAEKEEAAADALNTAESSEPEHSAVQSEDLFAGSDARDNSEQAVSDTPEAQHLQRPAAAVGFLGELDIAQNLEDLNQEEVVESLEGSAGELDDHNNRAPENQSLPTLAPAIVPSAEVRELTPHDQASGSSDEDGGMGQQDADPTNDPPKDKAQQEHAEEISCNEAEASHQLTSSDQSNQTSPLDKSSVSESALQKLTSSDQSNQTSSVDKSSESESALQKLASSDKSNQTSPKSPSKKTSKSESAIQKLSKTELFKLIDLSDATAEEIIEYLQARQRKGQLGPATHHSQPDVSDPPQVEHVLKDYDHQQGSVKATPSCQAGLAAEGDATNCDEVDCPDELAGSDTERTPNSEHKNTEYTPNSENKETEHTPRNEQPLRNSPVSSRSRRVMSATKLFASCRPKKLSVTLDLAKDDSLEHGLAEADRLEHDTAEDDSLEHGVAEDDSLEHGQQWDEEEEEDSDSDMEQDTQEQDAGASSTASLFSQDQSAQDITLAQVTEAVTSKVSGPNSDSSADTNTNTEGNDSGTETNTTETSNASCTEAKKALPQSSPGQGDRALRRITLKPAVGFDGDGHEFGVDPATSGGVAVKPQSSPSAKLPVKIPPTPSSGILKRGREEAITPPSSSKLRRVSFPNPVAVGGTPTCGKCAGVPSCDDCTDPEVEEHRQRFRAAYQRMKEKKEERRKVEERKKKIMYKLTPKRRLLVEMPVSPKKANASSRGGSSGDDKESQQSSNNSYHSTQTSQLDSQNPIFASLTSCSDSLESIVPSLTSTSWSRGLRSLLMARGLKTVGDLASLTELKAEGLPFTHPKTQTLKNALAKYEEKMFARAFGQADEMAAQWNGIPSGLFYKKKEVKLQGGDHNGGKAGTKTNVIKGRTTPPNRLGKTPK